MKDKEMEEELNISNYWLDKVRIQNPDIYKLIDQLIKEGKNQGYKISVTIE
jgi:hypothetical protein